MKARQNGVEVHEKRRRLMKANVFFSKTINILWTYMVIALCITFILNYVFRIITQIPGMAESLYQGDKGNHINYALSQAFHLQFSSSIVYLVWGIFFVLGFVFYFHEMKTSHEELNVGQKGNSRWTTRTEIDEQYDKVPIKDVRFPGQGGFPVARKEDFLYIDRTPSNSITPGTTRSGKDEMIVFPLIDNLSRAEEQSSIIGIDPKLELANASIPELERRGYECHLINLVEPEYSMGYNPLSAITEEYKTGNIPDAQLLCGAFCYSIFNPDTPVPSENKFFDDSATALLSALILAHIEDCLEEDRKENEERKYYHEVKEQKLKEKAIRRLPKRKQNIYLQQAKIREERKTNPDTSKEHLCFITGLSTEELEEVLSTESITIDYTYTPYVNVIHHEKNINMYSIAQTFSVLSSKMISEEENALDYYFLSRKPGNISRLLYTNTLVSGSRTKGGIYSTVLKELNLFTYENIAKLTAESTLNLSKIGFGDKPVAVFIGLPDYDHSTYFLATTFIRQLYFVLAKTATFLGGKCYRKVSCIVDEAGNIPPIENLATIITMCLGRNIEFHFIIQAFAQLTKLYGKEDADTIISNCSNKQYILSSSTETNEEFSRLIGSETITSVHRSGKKLELGKNYTEMLEERRLIDATELSQLKPGETIFHRTSKRTDKKGRPVQPFPIANLGKHRMLFRHEYLLGTFPANQILYRSEKQEAIIRSIQEFGEENNPFYKKTEELVVADIEIENRLSIISSKRVFDAEKYLWQIGTLHQNIFRLYDAQTIQKLSKLLKQPFFPEDEDYAGTLNLEIIKLADTAKKQGQLDIYYQVMKLISFHYITEEEHTEDEDIWEEIKDIATPEPQEFETSPSTESRNLKKLS